MTTHDWCVLNLPNFAINRAKVRGKLAVYSFNRFGVQHSLFCIYHGVSKDTAKHGGSRVTITVAKRGVPHKMQSVYRAQVKPLQEYLKQKAISK
jgi:hypothetical protein